jgi:hypothetical protein
MPVVVLEATQEPQWLIYSIIVVLILLAFAVLYSAWKMQ